MQLRLTPPADAAFLASDLTDFRKNAVPVADLEPIEVPDDAYLEYGWLDEHREYMPDPDPQHQPADNPWYAHLYGVRGPAYKPDPLNLGGANSDVTDSGTMDRLSFESQLLGGQKRRALLYTPPGLNAADPLPLVYCHDGLGFRHHGRFTALVDRLLAAGDIQPLKVVLVQPVKRENEYPFHDEYLRFTLDELVPQVEDESGFACDGQRSAMGASLSGLFSAWLAWSAPDVFGHVVSLSGAFITAPETRDDHRVGGEWFRQQIRKSSRKPIRFDLFCGRLEWITEANRNLAAALAEQGYDATYAERNVGHNWTGWRDALPGLMRIAFGPEQDADS